MSDTRTTQLHEQETPAGLMRIDRRFGTVLREGPWLVPGRIEVRLTAAEARLDFTEAVIGAGTVKLDVDLGLGSELTLVVQPGIKVVTEDLETRSGGDIKIRTASDGTVPVFLRVEVSGRLHAGGDLVIRRPKRNFDQWTRPGSAT